MGERVAWSESIGRAADTGLWPQSRGRGGSGEGTPSRDEPERGRLAQVGSDGWPRTTPWGPHGPQGGLGSPSSGATGAPGWRRASSEGQRVTLPVLQSPQDQEWDRPRDAARRLGGREQSCSAEPPGRAHGEASGPLKNSLGCWARRPAWPRGAPASLGLQHACTSVHRTHRPPDCAPPPARAPLPDAPIPAPVSTGLPSGSPTPPCSCVSVPLLLPWEPACTSLAPHFWSVKTWRTSLACLSAARVTAHVGSRPATPLAPQCLHAPSPPPGTSTPRTIAGPTAGLFPEVLHLPDSAPRLPGGFAPPGPTTTNPISHSPAGLPHRTAQTPQGVMTWSYSWKRLQLPSPSRLRWNPQAELHLRENRLRTHSTSLLPTSWSLENTTCLTGFTLTLYGGAQKYTKE